MTLYLLTRNEFFESFYPDKFPEDIPSFSVYVDCGAVLVRASNENEARRIASETEKYFLRTDLTDCEIVDPDGPSEFIMGDFPTG